MGKIAISCIKREKKAQKMLVKTSHIYKGEKIIFSTHGVRTEHPPQKSV